jgi:hypothetical protein
MTGKRGVLLTLAMLVLFILMLGELLTYIVISINYDQLSAGSSSAFSSTALLNFIGGGTSGFLTASLNNSLGALTAYESTPSLRTYHFINNTAYALTSLMTNGTIYGTSMSSYMGGATLNQYTSALKNIARLQGGNFTLSNITLTVYQAQPFYLSAKLTGLAVLNTSYGTTDYPISATANISLNGTQSLLGAQSANPSYIKGGALPQSLIGNTTALSGSRSPFMFAYGTAIYIGGAPSCSSVPAQFQNANYILVTPNAGSIPSSVCSMAGLVTNSLTTPPLTPYLIFPSNFISTNVIGSGTSVLLDGSGLALVDPSGLQAAIQNGYFLQASAAQSYLQAAQQSASKGPGPGIFTLGSLNRLTASFSGSASNIIAKNSLTGSQLTVTLWVKPSSTLGSAATRMVFNSVGTNNLGFGFVTGNTYMTEEISIGSNIYTLSANRIALNGNAWSFVAVTVGNSVANVYTGQSGNVSTAVVAGPYSLSQLQLGGTGGFSGNMSNVQVYNTVLAPGQISQIYLNGLGGTPISNASLAGWYPLNGNANDYSGMSNNGAAANIIYYKLAGYTADPIFSNLPNAYNTSVVKGVLNCANLNQCTEASLSHLYLGTRPLAVSNGTVQNESTALGIYNGVLPNGVDFLGTNSFISVADTPGLNPTSITMAAWFYPTGTLTGSLRIVAKSDGSGGDDYDMFFGTGACSLGSRFKTGAGGSFYQVAYTPCKLNTWYFGVVTYQSSTSTISLYMDGNLIGTSSNTVSGTLSSSTNSLTIGSGLSTHWAGIISDVQLYNSVLTTTQVQSLYLNNTVNGNTPIGYWPLTSPDNGLMNQTPDIVGGNTGLFHNANGMCTSANVVQNTCGALITQT